MRIMKYIHDNVRILINMLSDVLKGVDINSISLQEFINLVILYIYETQNEMDKNTIIDIIDDKSIKEAFMTIKERFIKDGEEKGRKEEQKVIAKKMKEKKISIKNIMEITGLSKDEIERI